LAHRASGVLEVAADRRGPIATDSAPRRRATPTWPTLGSIDPRLERSGRLDDRGERCIGVASTGQGESRAWQQRSLR
jgi:hypothetical protein